MPSQAPDECAICLLPPEDPTMTVPCHHLFCYYCILPWVLQQSDCPFCRTQIGAIRFTVSGNLVEVPVLPPALATQPMIVQIGPMTMVRPAAAFPLHLIVPVVNPVSRIVRHYAFLTLHPGQMYLGPQLPAGTTFAVPGSEVQMLEALESVGIGRIELDLRHQPMGGHEAFLEWHRHEGEGGGGEESSSSPSEEEEEPENEAE